MKTHTSTATLLAIGLLPLGCAKDSAERRPLATVAKVDVAKYTGKWHEVARLPNRFQRDDSTAIAEYTARPDGKIAVRNTEIRPDGSTKIAEGLATPVEGSNGARLRVKFGGLAALAPVSEEGNYWIVDLLPDYSAALVGTPSRKFLWLLSREPKLAESKRARLLKKAKAEGFDTARLIGPAAPGR